MRDDLEYSTDESLAAMLGDALRQRAETARDLRIQVMAEYPDVVARVVRGDVDDIAALAESLNWRADGDLAEKVVFVDRWSLAAATGRREVLFS